MRILITNHQYLFLAGTEIFTYTLASALKKLGHKVVIYSPYVGGLISEKTKAKGVEIVNHIGGLKRRRFDIIHAQHNATAIEARNVFPKTPMVFLSHGVLPFLEQPPVIDLGIGIFLAVSEEVRDNLLARGIPKGRVKIFRNTVDTERFRLERPIHKKPQKALIISNTLPEKKKRIIEKACRGLDIKTRYIGRVARPVWDVEKEINSADIVFSLGRGAIEALACGRVAVVYDYNGGDGLVTKENIDEIQRCNFSGRRFKKEYNVSSLKEELKKYDPHLGEEGRELALARFSAQRRISELIDIYRRVMRSRRSRKCDKELIGFLSDAILTTRQVSLWKLIGDQKFEEMVGRIRDLEKNIREARELNENLQELSRKLRAELDEIYNSRSWKLVAAFRRLKHSLPIVGNR